MSPLPPLVDETGIPDYLTRDEAARYMRCGLAYLAEMTAIGVLPSLKMGRKRLYRRVDLDEYLESRVVDLPGAFRLNVQPALDTSPRSSLERQDQVFPPDDDHTQPARHPRRTAGR